MRRCTCPETQTGGYGTSQLTAVVVECGEVGLLLCAAGAVAHADLQLVPGGFLQVVQNVRLGERRPLSRGPHCGPKGPVLEREGGDGTAAVIPADEVQPHARGVDAGKEFLLLGELGLCGGTHRGVSPGCVREMAESAPASPLSPPVPVWATSHPQFVPY